MQGLGEQLDLFVHQAYESGLTLKEAARELRRRFVLKALRAARGNQCQAANALNMHRNTLGRTVDELDIDIRAMRHEMRKRPSRSGARAQELAG